MSEETARLALTMGDINGIGPEVLVKALSHPEVFACCQPIVFGSCRVFEEACQSAGLKLPFQSIQHIEELPEALDVIPIYDAGHEAPAIRPGVIDPEAGRCAMEWVREAVNGAKQGLVTAIVTGPINKVGIHRAGYTYQGHTDFIAALCNVKTYRMCLFTETMRILHITGHLSLRDALDAVTQPRIVESIQIAFEGLKRLGFDAPRIAVAGLNPHAGEAGAFGREEIEIIAPAIEEANQMGYGCSGPYPPDTIFKRMRDGEFDMVIAMYHDQGHVPLKLIAMDEGVNVTLGIPIIRTSVDHGTAYEIAGANVAREDSMCAAIQLAARFAANRSNQAIK